MAKPVTARPPDELFQTLTRVMRQVNADAKMPQKRRKAIVVSIGKVLDELQKESVSRG